MVKADLQFLATCGTQFSETENKGRGAGLPGSGLRVGSRWNGDTCEACHGEPKQLASSVAIIPFSHILLHTKATLAKFELMEYKNPSILFSTEYMYQKFTEGNVFEIQEERTVLQKEAKTYAQT